MSCLYCGGEECGGSGGGPTMCKEHPDNKKESQDPQGLEPKPKKGWTGISKVELIKKLKARIAGLEGLFCEKCLNYFERKGYFRVGCYSCDLGETRQELIDKILR